MTKPSIQKNKRERSMAPAGSKRNSRSPGKGRGLQPSKPTNPPKWDKRDIDALMARTSKAPYLKALMNEKFIAAANTQQLTKALTLAKLLGKTHPQTLKSLRDYASVAAGALTLHDNDTSDESEDQASETSDSDDDAPASKPKGRRRQKKRRKVKHTTTVSSDSGDSDNNGHTRSPAKAPRQGKVTIGGHVLNANDDTVTVTNKTNISGTDMCTISSEHLNTLITCEAADLYASPFQYAYIAWEERHKTHSGTQHTTHRSPRNSSSTDSPMTVAFASLTSKLANTNDASTVLDSLSADDLALIRSFPTRLLDEAWNFDIETPVQRFLPRGYKHGNDNIKQTAIANYFSIISLLHPEYAEEFSAYTRKLQSDGLNQDVICNIIDATRKASARQVHPFASLHLQSLQQAMLKEIGHNKNKRNSNSNNNNSNSNNSSSSGYRNGGNDAGSSGNNDNTPPVATRQRKQFSPEQAAIFAECQAQKACFRWNMSANGELTCDKGEEHAVGGFANNQSVIKHHCGRCAGKHKITACTKPKPPGTTQ
jgi:hypothetical protein